MRVFSSTLVFLSFVLLSKGEEDNEDDSLDNNPPDVPYTTPEQPLDGFFSEHFDDKAAFDMGWVLSKATKDGVEASVAKYDGEWNLEQAAKSPLTADLGLVVKTKAKHAAISAKLKKPFHFKDDVLIVQYELNFQNGQDCGGGYIKLLSHNPDFDLVHFQDKTPYTIMFGPDKCGADTKFHFIFRHVNPKNQSIEEKHCKKLETRERAILDEAFKDQRPHLYRLVVRPDNSYEISMDYNVLSQGSLLEDFQPPVNPPVEIDDPEDFKPNDWDEREKIQDPDAKKPDDWDENQPRQIRDESAVMPEGWLEDEPQEIPDPDAEKPSDWDEEMDGIWEAALVANPACASAPGCGKWHYPMIDNPLFKGKWHAPLIVNPNYKGKWKPRRIPNPDYFFDPEPFKMTAIGGVGIEIWSMSSDIYFDNILLSDNLETANQWARNTFDLKVQKLDANDAGIFKRILDYSNRNPWIYAVYVVVVGLPLLLIVIFCCSGDGSKNKSHPKKTDEPQEDDVPEEDSEEVEETKEDAEIITPKKNTTAQRRKARRD